MMWQPIETAPKDGTEILLSDGACVSIGGWLSRQDVGDECPFGTDPGWWAVACHNPTHWMPLPDPPTQEGE